MSDGGGLPPLSVQKKYIDRFGPNLSREKHLTILGLVMRSSGAEAVEETADDVLIMVDNLDAGLVTTIYRLVRSTVEQLSNS